MPGLLSKKTVVPIDFSDLSFSALDRGIEIAGEQGEVHIIHVLAELTAMEPGNLYGTVTDETRIKSVEKHLREKLAGDKYARVMVHAVVGDAGREITALAEREDADLIVIPSHGYGFLKHMLLGSVAERVVRLAHCPVLVLRN
jgi:nucleotide-binding universal stress UspA family protein